MEPEALLLSCSQTPATGPYPKLDAYSPHLPPYFQISILIFIFHFPPSKPIFIFPSHLHPGLQTSHFP